ncbi:MAG: PqqD family protein [Nitrospirae bacterium]|nr:MAG: PqqD family protein [Nitrospirota bacterium]
MKWAARYASAMSDALSLTSHLRVPEGVLSHNLQGEEVILNLNTGVYFGLDPIGTRIWHLIHEHQSLRKVLDRLLEEYAVAEVPCAQDLLDLVARMRKKGLVDIGDGTAP